MRKPEFNCFNQHSSCSLRTTTRTFNVPTASAEGLGLRCRPRPHSRSRETPSGSLSANSPPTRLLIVDVVSAPRRAVLGIRREIRMPTGEYQGRYGRYWSVAARNGTVPVTRRRETPQTLASLSLPLQRAVAAKHGNGVFLPFNFHSKSIYSMCCCLVRTSPESSEFGTISVA
jgi:hypothetical protein